MIDTIPNADELLAVAIAAARAGGQHALNNRGRTSEVHEAFAHDIKLQLDLECQAKVSDVLRGAHPSHAILGEEDDSAVAPLRKSGAIDPAAAMAPLEWVVDPIDGTVNFFHGLPWWCCSVAVRQADRVLAGVVYAPEVDECFTATHDGPALLNGRPIHVSDVPTLAQAMLLTGLSRKGGPDAVSPEVFETLSRSLQKIRVLGAAALDMCRVARGHADAYWEPAIYVWDMAAASLVVERAGGRASVLGRNGNRLSVLCTNGCVHEDLRALLPVPRGG